jgi:hypothetical protein
MPVVLLHLFLIAAFWIASGTVLLLFGAGVLVLAVRLAERKTR